MISTSKWEKHFTITKLTGFFDMLSINEVVVLGHSMGYVDFEYMEIIENMLNPDRWLVTWYDINEKKDILNRRIFHSLIKYCFVGWKIFYAHKLCIIM